MIIFNDSVSNFYQCSVRNSPRQLANAEEFTESYHSHKKQIVWKHFNRNLYVMLKFSERPKTPGMTSKKNIAFPEGNKQSLC